MKRLIRLTLLVLVGSACNRPASVPHPNVLVITIDTLRRDQVGVYGAGPDATPALDRLARDGVVFDSAISVASWTKPTVVSLLTGLHPRQHQVFRGGNTHADRLAPEVPTVAEALREVGYSTAAFVDNEHLRRRYSGLERGFDTYAEELGAAPLVVHNFLDWLERTPRRPFFAYLHILDPHWPYTPSAPRPGRAWSANDERLFGEWGFFSEHWWLLRDQVNDGRLTLDDAETTSLRTAYADEVWQTDAVIGRLMTWLEQAQLLDTTLVVVTSDHGEGFREHRRLDHGYGPYDELLRIPLIVRFPGRAHAGERHAGMVQPTDIAATVLQVAGIPLSPRIHAVPLQEIAGTTETPSERMAYSEERYGGMTVASLRSATHKYIRREVQAAETSPPNIEIPAELQVGDRVRMEGMFADGRYVAAQIRRIDNEDRDVEVVAPIARIDGGKGTFEILGFTVQTDATTALRDGERHMALAELRASEWVRVQGEVRGTALQARRVERQLDPLGREVEFEGIVEAITADDGAAILHIGGRHVPLDRRAAWAGVSGERRSLGSATRPPVHEPAEELYDLAADPGEQHDLAAAAPALASVMQHRMDEVRADLDARGRAKADGADLDAATRDRLRALGYLD